MESKQSESRRPWPIYTACALFTAFGLLPIVEVFVESSDLGDALIMGALGPFVIIGSAVFAFFGRDFGRHALLAYFGFLVLFLVFGWIASDSDEGIVISSLGEIAMSIVLLSIVALLYLPVSNSWYRDQ